MIFNSHLTGMPHIHGVAWIDESTLNDFGIKDQFLCDGREENVTKLVDALISCEIPEPLPLTQFSTEEEKRQSASYSCNVCEKNILVKTWTSSTCSDSA